MLKLNDIYNIKGKDVDLRDWSVTNWLPDINGTLDSPEVLEALHADNRLRICELVNDYVDGYRVKEMVTVWFDGLPVYIAQRAGRGGSDHKKRWITDAARFDALVRYVISKTPLELGDSDVVDGETLMYPEEVFEFYGEDIGPRFGFPREPRTDGYLLLSFSTEIIETAEAGQVLVMLRKGLEPAPYIRRGGFVMAFDRPLSEPELASNDRLTSSLEGSDYDRYVWYREAQRPENADVIAI